MSESMGNTEKEVDARPYYVLTEIVQSIIENRHYDSVTRVAVDGVDGSGKTMFADTLAHFLAEQAVPVIRVSVDDFHRPRAERYVRGRYDPEGFYRDSYDYEAFTSLVLKPLGKGGNRKFKSRIHDVSTDTSVDIEEELAAEDAVLVVDGIFLNRDELTGYWDYSIFLDVDFDTTFGRMANRDGTSPDPYDELNQRYREGQLIYLRECDPKARASIIVDNRDFLNPKIIR